MKLARFVIVGSLSIAAWSAQNGGGLVDRVGTTGFLQLEAESFKALPPSQKVLAYWLSQASIAIDPIIYDQLSRFGLRQKRLLEAVVSHSEGLQPDLRQRILEFTKLFWANRGNHNENTAQKFLPDFRFEELAAAAQQAFRRGAFRAGGNSSPYGTPAIKTEADLRKELEELRRSLFDPEFEPMTTAKTPPPGQDLLQASANNFYSGVTMDMLRNFHERYPLNSRLVKDANGRLVEQVYRAGTPDGRVPPGLYAQFLRKANDYLEKARAAADPAQARVIADLIRFYQTGEFEDWLRFGASWVQNNARVDFANGFIEVYADARAAKGTSQSFVCVTDASLETKMHNLAQNAQYFEDRAPWPDQYKKRGVKPPVAKAVEAIVETGDFHVTTIGDNLPNENEIHQKYGTKSFMFTGSTRALNRAIGSKPLEEFAASPEELAICKKYDDEAEDLMTALHEVIGHGSGKPDPKLTREPKYYLKEYGSTLEEARADLMALWNVFDPKLRELGLISSPDVGKAMYYAAARAPLIQLRRIPKGNTIEEDHQRNRQLIVNYIMDKNGSIAQVKRNGKTYMVIRDFDRMRQGVGMLLGELMRIKATGDYNAIRDLVNRYGTHFDPKLRDEVVSRYQKLNLPTYWAGINADLTAAFGGAGKVADVQLSYPRDYARQQLSYAAMYR